MNEESRGGTGTSQKSEAITVNVQGEVWGRGGGGWRGMGKSLTL
jgi:hypothetical protein